jgi:hypothetical protein
MGKQPLLGRVILDNDFAGDPDGLFQLAHHVLSRSVSIPLIIGSHLPAGFSNGHEAQDLADRALELLKVMGLDKVHHPVAGSETPITSRQVWRPSKATDAIIHEAMRDDTTEPLIYAAGAGLTELALAWLREPRIGKRIKLIWIGGKSPQDLGNPGPEPTSQSSIFQSILWRPRSSSTNPISRFGRYHHRPIAKCCSRWPRWKNWPRRARLGPI